jgi:hypothetical protein
MEKFTLLLIVAIFLFEFALAQMPPMGGGDGQGSTGGKLSRPSQLHFPNLISSNLGQAGVGGGFNFGFGGGGKREMSPSFHQHLKSNFNHLAGAGGNAGR